MQVVNSIKKAILRGDLKIGDKLPNESELAKAIGVGRSSFREGMRILEAYGIVEIRQGEGTYVIDRSIDHIFEFLSFIPSEENMEYFVNLRRVVEAGSIKMVYNKLTDVEYKELQTLVFRINRQNSINDKIAADKEFHEKLVFYTNNPLIVQIYNMMSEMLSALMYQLMCYEDVAEDARNSHQQILDALRDHDLERSVIAMDNHLKAVENYVRKYIKT